MPIINHKYNPQTDAILYTVSGSEGGEIYTLYVAPHGQHRTVCEFWRGAPSDKLDSEAFAPSDPMDLYKTKQREDFVGTVRSAFGPDVAVWVAELMLHIIKVHPEYLRQAREALQQAATSAPDYVKLPGADPVMYRTPEGYRVEATQGGNLITISNYTGRILEDVRVDDGSGETQRFYVVRARVAGEEPTTFDVPAGRFDGLSWVPTHLGALAFTKGGLSGARELVTRGIRSESASRKKTEAYGHTGWRELGEPGSGSWAYLHAGGAIVAADAPSFSGRVVLEDKLARRRLPPLGSLTPSQVRSAVRASLRLWDLAPDPVSIPVMLSAVRAAIGEVDYSVHLAGPSGFGKTMLSHLALSHFGPGLGAEDSTNYASTPNSIELEAFRLKDQLLVLDDFLGTPAHRRILAFVARNAANNSGRGRMAADFTLRGDRPPRALILSTGEYLPGGESLTARLLILRLAEPLDFYRASASAPLNAAKTAASEGKHAVALAAYLRHQAPRYGELLGSLEGERRRHGWEVRSLVRHARTPSVYGDLMVAAHTWLGFAGPGPEGVGAIDAHEHDAMLDRAKAAIVEAIYKQAEYLGAADPLDRYQALLVEAVLSGKATLDDGGEGRRIGWASASGTYLYPSPALEVVKQMARELGEAWSLSSQELNRRLHERGLLVSTDLEKKRRSIPTRRKRTKEGKLETVLHLSSDYLSTGGTP